MTGINYYRLNWDTYANEEMANTLSASDNDVPWGMGMYYPLEIETPIHVELNPERGRVMPELFLIDIPLFSDALIDNLLRCGIENLQLFDALIRSPEGEVFTNYKAVNIVGAIACADLDRSTFDAESTPPMMDFEHLVLDSAKTSGQQMFRLAEDTLHIIVSEHVKDSIAAADFPGVILTQID